MARKVFNLLRPVTICFSARTAEDVELVTQFKSLCLLEGIPARQKLREMMEAELS